MDVLILIIAVVGGAAGIFSTLYLTFSLPAVLVWKIFRKAKYGTSVMY